MKSPPEAGLAQRSYFRLETGADDVLLAVYDVR